MYSKVKKLLHQNKGSKHRNPEDNVLTSANISLPEDVRDSHRDPEDNILTSENIPLPEDVRDSHRDPEDNVLTSANIPLPELVRDSCDRFRILVVGRANAGKTTILRKVCNAAPDASPEIYDAEGNKVDIAILNPSQERGMHELDCELVFPTNPGFIFHDSRGFEAGGKDEVDTVTGFIEKRAGMMLKDQLHAIWYCIPMDTNRPWTNAEKLFFSTDVVGAVPVIAIFTKFDAYDARAFGELLDEGKQPPQALQDCTARAERNFNVLISEGKKSLSKEERFPEKYTILRNMHKPNFDCKGLVATTASAINKGVLTRLFVSRQKINLSLCAEYAMRSSLKYCVEKFLREV